MNKREKKMLDILKKLRDECGVVSIKAEFEAEGTRTDELLRLVEITRRANLKLALKIGGCEAIRDLIESKQIGVDYIIAPMVETPYALSKFVLAKNKIYTADDQLDTDFLVNVETISGFDNVAEMARLASAEKGLDGLVFGRVDFVGSKGWRVDDVNTPKVTDYVVKVAAICKEHKLDIVVGGAVSKDALSTLEEIKKTYLTRFETRKVIFAAGALDNPGVDKALLEAVHFELLWLENKRDYYSLIMSEDDARIKMVNDRWKVLSGSSEAA
ncbi:MAG TPA: aldolase/citrate lyase family protein [Herbaspirillum sp.]|jgi:hypothetical protein|nr:aldolase/citrate lyase family protein [Herbaspirillum sp.]